MANKRKSWVEKRDFVKAPHVTVTDKAFAGVPAGSKLLISSPLEIDEFIRNIPKGTQMEPHMMRDALAKRHQADVTCPMSTGIFLRIVAEAALEEYNGGKPLSDITPFWRVITPDSTQGKKLGIGEDEFEAIKNLAGE